MAKQFKLEFDFPVEDIMFRLKAIVESQPINSLYRIHSFEHISNGEIHENLCCSLSDIEIQCVKRNTQKIWVHKDSGKETALSKAIGKAIDNFEYSN